MSNKKETEKITEARYCLYHCPHKHEKCKGDCEEFKSWRKLHDKRYKNGGNKK